MLHSIRRFLNRKNRWTFAVCRSGIRIAEPNDIHRILCPFGLIQDLLHKIKTLKIKKNKLTRALSYFKYVILVFFVVIIPLAYMFRDYQLPAFCKYICPAGTLGGAIALLINPANEDMLSRLGPLFTWKFLVLVLVVVGSVFIYRFPYPKR